MHIKKAASLAQKLVTELMRKGYLLSLAESCTAGLVSSLISEISGASQVLWGSYICYSKQAKVKMLCIDEKILIQYGLVSRETANELAIQALNISNVNISASVTGLAGPKGDGSNTPIGTVWIAAFLKNQNRNSPILHHIEKEFHFLGTRLEVRLQAAIAVLEILIEILQ